MRGSRIWIVDDREPSRRFLADALGPLEDVAIETFDAGEPALAAALAGTPDLVLLDAMLPRVDGFTACRALRHRFGEELVPIVLVTANPDRELYGRAIEAGADDYLVQPIEIAELQGRVRAFLRQRDRYRTMRSERERLGARVEELAAEVASREDQLVLAERLAATGIMAAGLSHQLKNPLTAVTLNLDLCVDHLPPALAEPVDDPTAERARLAWTAAFQAIREATDAVIQLVSDLGTFSRPDHTHDRLAEVAQVIDAVLRIAHHRIYPVATLRRELAGPLTAAIQPSRLAQVILSLLVEASRAIEASGQRGVITLRSARRGHEVVLEVDQSAPSPDPAALDRLFDPIGLHPDRPAGFGLSISRALVRRVGGELTAELVAGNGTRFRVRLPAA